MSKNTTNSDFVTQQQLLRRQMNSHEALNRRDSTSRWNNQHNNSHNRGGRGGRSHQNSTYDHRFYARLREPNVRSTAPVGCPAQLINAEEMVKQFAAAQPTDGDDDYFDSPSEVLPGVPGDGDGVQPSVAPLMSGKPDSSFSSSQTSGRPPPLSYAAALGAAALTGATKTVNATITNITNFDLTQFARDLQKARLFEQVDAIQIYGARNNIELQMASTDAAVTLARVGLNTHGRHLSFEVERPPTISVSLLGVNVHLPNALVKEEMARFGEVVDVWEARHRLLHRTVRNGTRVVQFKKLTRPVPSNVTVFGRRVRAIYTGQAAHLAAWKRDAEDARQPAVDVATASEGAQGGAPGVDFNVTSAQSGAVMPAETHPSLSLAGSASLVDGAAALDPPGSTIPSIPVNPPKEPPPSNQPPARKATKVTIHLHSADSTARLHISAPASPPAPTLPAVLPPPPSPAAPPSPAPVTPAAPTVLIASTPPTPVQPLSSTDPLITTTTTAVHRSCRQESSGVRCRSLSPPRSSPEESPDDKPRLRRQRTAFDKHLKKTNPLLDSYRHIDPAASSYDTDTNMEVVPVTEDHHSTDTDDTMPVDRYRIPKRTHASDGTDDATATVRKYSKQSMHNHFTQTAVTRTNVFQYLQKRTLTYADRDMAFIDLGVATGDLPTAHAWYLDLKFGKYQILDKVCFNDAKSDTFKSLPTKKTGGPKGRKDLLSRWKIWSRTQEAVQTETMDGIVETIRIHITSVVSKTTTIQHS